MPPKAQESGPTAHEHTTGQRLSDSDGASRPASNYTAAEPAFEDTVSRDTTEDDVAAGGAAEEAGQPRQRSVTFVEPRQHHEPTANDTTTVDLTLSERRPPLSPIVGMSRARPAQAAGALPFSPVSANSASAGDAAVVASPASFRLNNGSMAHVSFELPGMRDGGPPPSPGDRSPLAMLRRSFAFPVSDERAREDSIRMTLGHDPAIEAPETTGGGGHHLSNASMAAMSAVSGGDRDRHHDGELLLLPTRSFSQVVTLTSSVASPVTTNAPSQSPDATTGGAAGAEPEVGAGKSAEVGNALGAVVPHVDETQQNGGLPMDEELKHDTEGDPYVFRYNIRVATPPAPALLATDPQLLSVLNHSVANGNLLGYNGVGGPSANISFAQRLPADDEGRAASHGSQELSSEAPHAAHDHRDADSLQAAPPRKATAGTPGSPDGRVCFSAEEVKAVDEKLAVRHRRKYPHQASAEQTALAAGGDAQDEGPRMDLGLDTNTFITTGSFRAQPILMDDVQRERIIVDCFNSLSSETRRLELLEAFYTAHLQPYELQDSFTGDNWDDVMAHTKVRPWFKVEFDHSRYCFYVTVLRRRHRVFLFSFLLRSFCIFLFWVLMFCLVPYNWFYPGGLYFDTITTILFAGIVGTIGARLINIPTLIGVIWMGILWNNVPYTGRLTKGINLDIRQFVSYFGLSVGIIRAGLSLNVIRFKQKFKHYILFSILPMASEMVVHGVCCKYIYSYPNFRWAFAEGFLVSSIAPSVVVPIIIRYQRKGYGVKDGPPMMMLCSIAIDTACCVWGVQFLLALEFQTMSTALIIVLAPVQILVGLVGGVLLGVLVFLVTFYVLFMEAERIPGLRNEGRMTLRHSVHVRYVSIGFMVLTAFTCMAVGKRFQCVGGAAIGVVAIASTFNYLCVRGGTRDHLRVKADMAQTLTTVWDYVAMPSLFGLSGASVNVHELFARDFIGQAFGLVFMGIGVRGCMAMLVPVMTRLGLSWRELIFCGVGWIGKGSVQGSMGGTALMYSQKQLAAANTTEAIATAEYHVRCAIKMKNTAMLGILVACPLCSIFLTQFTSKLLKKDV